MKEAPMSVEMIDKMGTDLTVVNAARVSFEKESEWESVVIPEDHPLAGDAQFMDVLSQADQKLIKYLAKHNHWTPFGHCSASFRIKAPIFVARQLVKHQVGLVWNEVSRRYVDSEPEFYIPETFRGRAENVKQGSADEPVERNQDCRNMLRVTTYQQLTCYNYLLASGVCPEQARMVLPLNSMTEWVWSGTLAAWSRVCKLRLDPHTQKETRDIAACIDGFMKDAFPVSWEALQNV